jgi:HEAT repeats
MSKRQRLTCCGDVAPLLVFYACNELSEHERTQIAAHLLTCQACSSQLTEERLFFETLSTALQSADELDPAGTLLSQCRSELAEALDDLSTPPVREHWRPFGWLRSWMALRPVWSGALLVLVGLAVGSQMSPWFAPESDTIPTSQVVNISPGRKFTDEQLAKMAVAGINLAPAPGATPGTLQLQVRTEQPLILSGSVDDPDVRRVLTYVVANGQETDPSVRMDCLDYLKSKSSDLDVRRALLIAARHDQNPAVRIKALDSLQDSVGDKSVREALVDALQADSNPGVRVEAVNLLVRAMELRSLNSMEIPAAPPAANAVAAPKALPAPAAVDPSFERVVRTLQALKRNDPNRNVRLRSAAALRQIGPREVQ